MIFDDKIKTKHYNILLIKNSHLIVTFFLLLFLCGCSGNTAREIDLAGTWKFQKDASDLGLTEKWFSNNLLDTIQLPGSMAINGKGDAVDLNTKWLGYIGDTTWYESPNYKPYLSEDEFLFPFWLIPEKHYYGLAWYQKEVDIPEDWKSKNIELYLERCHWETRVWVNNIEVGTENSLGTAHRFNLTNFLKPGKHRITIAIDNRVKDIDVGPNAHSISDHTQTNWNGIVGDIKLIAKNKVSISNIQIYPDIKNKIARVEINLDNDTGIKQNAEIKVWATAVNNTPEKNIKVQKTTIALQGKTGIAVVEYNMGNDVLLWDEFNPNLYELHVEIKAEENLDSKKTNFGMRELSIDKTHFQINGRPTFLRGTLECAIFPKTGFPPTDIESWERIIKICKNHGLNHIRFHSWCPPKAAFDAADKLGFYYQIECSSWGGFIGGSVGDGKPLDNWLYREGERMIEAYGNHPSFCLMAYGNEPSGTNSENYLRNFVSHFRKIDSRRLHTCAAGWPQLEENDFHSLLSNARLVSWEGPINSIINKEAPKTNYDWSKQIDTYNKPVITHEIGQWCVYPNLKEIDKYDGVLKAKNFEIFKKSLEAHSMSKLADSFLLASGKLQALCYKAEIEAALRTSKLGGFQLLDLHDFPGQGTALVGVLDVFWEEKGYISPEAYKRFCNETVPLARLEKRVFTSNENIEAIIEVSHFGKNKLTNVSPSWKITNSKNEIVKQGKLKNIDIDFKLSKLGHISEHIAVSKAEKFYLEVDVAGFKNGWDIWVYPENLPNLNTDLLVVDKLTKGTLDRLAKGKNVLLTIKKGSLKDDKGGDIALGFSPIFWNSAWNGNAAPHTLGLLCNPEHPALANFPTEFHSNWQWWDAMSYSNAISLEGFSKKPEPIVRIIDDWVTNRNLALLFEVKVGNGKLLVSGIDLQSNMEKRPEARQLLFSLKNYMNSSTFNPQTNLSGKEVLNLFE